jgi:hypothetical protein
VFVHLIVKDAVGNEVLVARTRMSAREAISGA